MSRPGLTSQNLPPPILLARSWTLTASSLSEEFSWSTSASRAARDAAASASRSPPSSADRLPSGEFRLHRSCASVRSSTLEVEKARRWDEVRGCRSRSGNAVLHDAARRDHDPRSGRHHGRGRSLGGDVRRACTRCQRGLGLASSQAAGVAVRRRLLMRTGSRTLVV